jgi:phage gpG-like protein
MTPDELPAYLARLRQKVAEEGPKKAANAMARAFHNEVVGVELIKSSHAPGTRTPAPPGGPPAAVTGALRRSVRLTAARDIGAYRARSEVGPRIVYARIQELGGTVTAKHMTKGGKPGYLRWGGGPGGYRFAHSVTLPARPYMRPVHRRMIADGRLRQAAADAVRGLVP